MKGSLEGVLPMLGLLIIAGVLTMQTLPVQGILTEIMTESAEDIENMVETREGYEHFTNHLITESAEVAVHEATYELDEGGVDWQSEVPEKDVTGLVQSGIDNLNDESSTRFQGNLGVFQCNADHELEIDISYIDNNDPLEDYIETISLNIENSQFNDPLTVSCNPDTEYRTEQFGVSFSVENEWIQLLNSTAKFFDHSYQEFEESEVQETYYAEDDNCGPFDDGEEAIDEVEDKYESDTPSQSDLRDGVEGPGSFGSIVSKNDNYATLTDETQSTDDVCRTECDERADPICSIHDGDESQCESVQGCTYTGEEPEGSCNEDDDEDPECIDETDIYTHESEAEISPISSNVELSLWTNNQDVPAEGEYRELQHDTELEYDW